MTIFLINLIAQIEWYIFKPYRNNGYAKEAVLALARRAFSGKLIELREGTMRYILKKHYAKIDIIRAYIRSTNLPSQALAKSCGFTHQFTEHRHYLVEGEGYEDGEIYELTAENCGK